MKIGIISAGDPLDVNTWSGTPYYMTRHLISAYPNSVIIKSPRPSWSTFTRKALRKLTRGRVDLYWNQALSRWDANRSIKILKTNRVDIAICIGNAPISACVGETLATIHVSDATVPLMRDYYQEFSRLPRSLLTSANEADRRSVRNARACLYPTSWAASSAIQHYGADPSRVHVIPWGGNLPSDVSPPVEPMIRSDTCHLVFIGVDWKRKGGDLAVATARSLAAAGHPVKLHLIGSAPDLLSDKHVLVHGFINKSTQEGVERLSSIMRQASFLFVPTRQDCYGMVFSEANSFGLPVITTRTGGVPGVVVEGVNGHLLSSEAGPDEYARLIWTVWSDPARYSRLRDSSWRRFSEVLNWGSWLEQAKKVIDQIGSDGARGVAKVR